VVRKALDEPAYWIATNAGLEGRVAVNRARELGTGQGLNAATGEYGDLIAAGIVDPVKVTRSAVRNAASIAGMLLTTETLVVDKPEHDEADAGHGHGHSHGPGGHSH
jgi:chaperonin GroEL